MNLPLVSVIIPAKNRLEWLRQTIDSVEKQNYPNIEIILIDDGSTPPLKDIPLIPKGKIQIHYLRNENSKGPGFAREQGKSFASGKYINYLDSDDMLRPEKIQKQVYQMEANETLGMTYCISIRFSDPPASDGQQIWSISDQSFSSILPILLFQRPWSTSSCLWRKSVLDEIGPWSSLRIGEDIEYESRAGCLGIQIMHIPEPLCLFRIHKEDEGLTNSSIEHQIEETKYKLLVSENIIQSQYLDESMIQKRTFQMLFNQAVFLFDHEEKKLGIRCLKQAQKCCPSDRPTNFIIKTIILGSHLLSRRNLLRLARYLRSKALFSREELGL